MTEIALVDDENTILTSVRLALEVEGFTTRCFTDGNAALASLTEKPADLGIFDIKMPRMDGLELLRRLREQSTMPVMFLTSKDEEIDEIFGLRMGADDYITKPFSQRLLVERIRAVLRRTRAREKAPSATHADKIMTRGELTLDLERHDCLWQAQSVSLTVTEFLILESLAARPGVVKSREALMDAAYEEQIYVDDRTIDSHIKRLRRKLRGIDDAFDGIETIYGVGYRYREKS